MSLVARIYIGCIITCGIGGLLLELANWRIEEPARAAVFLFTTGIGSLLKVRLPGITGSMSVYFLFVLIAITQLSLIEVLVVGTAAVVVQCFWHAKNRPRPVQILFNVGSTALAMRFAYAAYHWRSADADTHGGAIRLAAMALVFFVVNTGPVALVISLTEGKPVRRVWEECYFWCFPYYLLGATIAGIFNHASKLLGWEAVVLSLPVIYVVYGAYRLYLGRLEDERNHATEVAALHLRTIEALALAIDAKDHTTHEHLQRVQVYALEIGKEMEVSQEELRALEAAALLHDIGKLAVPEHIISKPGKLTPEEFSKMKIHPIVGAEILERVQFPYPVVPIVLAHHEKWDGSGYPYGLRGEEIPIGARILSAVDCMDALASDRPYRRAMPLEEAVRFVEQQAGVSFDPRVAEVLCRRYQEFEKLATGGMRSRELARLPRNISVDRGKAPGAGFENSGPRDGDIAGGKAEFLNSIAAARQEAQTLFELAQTLGNSLSLEDTLSMLSARLGKLVSFDAMAVYILRGDRLKAEYVVGEDARLFASLEIPLGQGLSGWVAEKRTPIINGTPSVEAGYLQDGKVFSKLNSALAVPLETADSVIGVLSLYSAEWDAFSRDQLRVLQAIASKLSVSVDNALRYEQAETSATMDYLTALPNARSLFVHLEGELARCARAGTSLAVVVGDLDGFKQVNDRFGHLAGNEILRCVAAGLKRKVRDYDYVARMGGDEFVLVLPEIPEQTALAKIEQLNNIVIEAGQEMFGEELLSLSAGLALFPRDGRRAEDLLAEADRRMYRHKQEFKRVRSLMSFAGCRPAQLSTLVQ